MPPNSLAIFAARSRTDTPGTRNPALSFPPPSDAANPGALSRGAGLGGGAEGGEQPGLPAAPGCAGAPPPANIAARALTLPVTGDAPAFRAPNAFVSGFSRGWTGGPTGAPRDPGADCRTRAGRARYPAGTATDGARA